MAVKRHNPGYNHAKELIGAGRVVLDDRDGWSEHQPSAAEEDAFIQEHGYAEYGRWHLAIDDAHRCATLAAESRAGQRKYVDVELAAAHLHGMLDALRQPGPR